MLVFEKAGRNNTMQTLEAAITYALEHRIEELVVASTFGETGVKAAELINKQGKNGLKLIVVTHNYGFKGQPGLEMAKDTKKKLTDTGAVVYTGTMPFRNIGTAIREGLGYSQQDLIANTLRLLGQGVKVCVEIALMAYDAGLLEGKDIVAVAGTVRGADTACLIKPVPSNKLFNLKIRRIIAKPMDW